MANIRQRIQKLQDKLSLRYATIEDLLRATQLKRKGSLTEAERRTLAELDSLPLSPDLAATLTRLAAKRRGGIT